MGGGYAAVQGYGPYPGPPGAGPGAPPPLGRDEEPRRRQSQVETSLSVPKPDPAAIWLAQQAANQQRGGDSMSTVVLVAVAVLAAICVVALATLVYFKKRSPTGALETPSPVVVMLSPRTSPSLTP